MNTYQSGRPGRGPGPSSPAGHTTHAALLIDFDNVTLGIRSDLTKELRTLLNSDIIKGKVAVQRAYADWRRYPQYIVPLSESSIDLIFAPAFGTNKKNATDIRLAVDAIELVFTRSEIGTFILLSGDSDFSSLVIKLKEYGKYVVGVGIRESASDLLIQNCDEYYSYSDLAGLTLEEDVPSIQRDPWELVVEAVAQMQRADDVMRSDRLKQVMQQMDPNFDERNAGFNRFSKFVTEAGTRGLITVAKLDNGQYEVGPSDGRGAKAKGGRRDRPEDGAGKGRDTGRGRDAAAAVAEPAEEGGRRRRGRRGRGRDKEAKEAKEPKTAAEAEPAPPPRDEKALTLAEAFQLLQQALDELPQPAPHDHVRARMLALLGREDSLLDADRFPRFLRQANDAEVADVRKVDDNHYEILPHKAQRAMQAATQRAAKATSAATPEAALPDTADEGDDAEARGPATLRFRRGSRGPVRPADVPLVGVVKLGGSAEPAPKAKEAAPAEDKAEAPKKTAKKRRSRKKAAKPKAEPQAAAADKPAAEEPAKTASEDKPAKQAAKKRSRKRAKKAAPKKEAPAE